MIRDQSPALIRESILVINLVGGVIEPLTNQD